MAKSGKFNLASFKQECDKTISNVQSLLKTYNEWEVRYNHYANLISGKLSVIKAGKKRFYEAPPLYLYMNVTSATGNLEYTLRYLGQKVAILKVGKNNITISTKAFDTTNFRDFKCNIKLVNADWTSNMAKEFRGYFNCVKRTGSSGKGNEEHRVESLLLTEFSKKSSKDKIIKNIQPVKIANIARFQMPTPISASNMKKLKYSKQYGGGIDILSRVGKGKATKLCIMEVKDENILKEPPSKAIQQALAYAAFMSELLKSQSGQMWWYLFGFKGIVPKNLELQVACVMPSNANNNFAFRNLKFKSNQTTFILNYVYFCEINKVDKMLASF